MPKGLRSRVGMVLQDPRRDCARRHGRITNEGAASAIVGEREARQCGACNAAARRHNDLVVDAPRKTPVTPDDEAALTSNIIEPARQYRRYARKMALSYSDSFS